MLDEAAIRVDICRAGRVLWERGLVGAAEGNITARLGEDRLIGTPAGAAKGSLKPDELVAMDLEGSALDGRRPSSEVRLHARVYKHRADVRAVVHAHPLVATAFSVAQVDLPSNVLPEADFVLGPVARVPFGFPGTEEVADQLEPFLQDHKTFLLTSHGALTLGGDVEDACQRMETLERMATLLLHARALGQVTPLPVEASLRLRATALHGRVE